MGTKQNRVRNGKPTRAENPDKISCIEPMSTKNSVASRRGSSVPWVRQDIHFTTSDFTYLEKEKTEVHYAKVSAHD